MTKAKTELLLVHTNKDGAEFGRKILVKDLDQTKLSTYDVEWVQKAIREKEYDDDLPEAGMGSGCW